MQWGDTMVQDAKLAGIEQDLESMAANRAQRQDMPALLVSQHQVAKIMMK